MADIDNDSIDIDSIDTDIDIDAAGLKIVSVSHTNLPIGVNHTKPARQPVRVNAPVQNWVFHKVGLKKYKLSIGGYSYTGVHNGKVIASVNRENSAEWLIEHHVNHNAYTIALATDHHVGWTVPHNLAEGHQIEIAPIRATHSLPPQYAPTQLFLFKKA